MGGHTVIKKNSRTRHIVPNFSPNNFARYNPMGFSPLQYDVITWYRGDSVVKDGGNNISQVNDLSGNGIHAVPSTSLKYPLWVDAVLNGKPTIRFAGNANLIANFGATYTHPYTIFIVWKSTNINTNSYVVFDGIEASKRAVLYTYLGFVPFSGLTTEIKYAKSVPFANFIISSVIGNGASSKLYEDGLLKVTGSSTVGSLSGLIIGDAYNFTNAYSGDIAEIIPINGLLSALDHNKFLSYLGRQYNISTTPVL